MTVLVTGCAGFIGSNFAYTWLGTSNELVVNLDKLTYAGIRLSGMHEVDLRILYAHDLKRPLPNPYGIPTD